MNILIMYFRYAIPPKYGRSFEKLVEQIFPNDTAACFAFFRHKTVVMSPDFLN